MYILYPHFTAYFLFVFYSIQNDRNKKGESIDTESTTLPNGNTTQGSSKPDGYIHQNGFRPSDQSLARKRNQSKQFQDFSDNKLFTIDDNEVAKTYGYVPFRPSNQYIFQGNTPMYDQNNTSWEIARDANLVDQKLGSISVPTSPAKFVYPQTAYNHIAMTSSYMHPVPQGSQGHIAAIASPYMYPVQHSGQRHVSPSRGKSLKRHKRDNYVHPPLQRSYTLPAYVPEAYYVMPNNGWAGNVYYG